MQHVANGVPDVIKSSSFHHAPDQSLLPDRQLSKDICHSIGQESLTDFHILRRNLTQIGRPIVKQRKG